MDIRLEREKVWEEINLLFLLNIFFMCVFCGWICLFFIYKLLIWFIVVMGIGMVVFKLYENEEDNFFYVKGDIREVRMLILLYVIY